MVSSYIAYLITFLGAISFSIIADLLFLHKHKCSQIEKVIRPINSIKYNDIIKGNKTLYGNELLGCFFLLLSILVLCMNASLRSTEVGADVKGYLLPAYNYAQRQDVDFIDLLKQYGSWLEYGYCLLVYWGAKHVSLNFVFFLIQFISLLPVYYSFFKKRNESKITYGVVVYCFLFYNFGLSATRQIIAMGFILLEYILIDEKKYVVAAIVQVIAYSFHRSSLLIGASILLIHIITGCKKRKQIFFWASIFLAAFFVVYSSIVRKVALIIQRFNGRYASYIFSCTHSGFVWGDIMLSDFISKTIISITVLLIVWGRVKDNPYLLKLLSFVMLGEYFTVFNANFNEATRIAVYYHFFFIILLPYVEEKYIRKDFKSLLANVFGFLMPSVLYWVYFIMIIGAYVTNNYHIMI